MMYSSARGNAHENGDCWQPTCPICEIEDALAAEEPTCEWCQEPTDETGTDNACMIAHCLDCLGRCRYCQDDMKAEWDR